MARPTGVSGRPQLKQEDLIRIQVLSRDAKMGPSEIQRVTGYSIHQIKYVLKKKTFTVGIRTGRPRKGESSKKKGDGEHLGEGQEGSAEEESMVVEGSVHHHLFLEAEGQGKPETLTVGHREHDQQAVFGEPAPLTAGDAMHVEQLGAQHNQHQEVMVGQPQAGAQLEKTA
jgi:hypothetical protein